MNNYNQKVIMILIIMQNIYIYIYRIGLWYAYHRFTACYAVRISIFGVQIVDPNRLMWSRTKYIRKPNFTIFKTFLLFLMMGKNHCFVWTRILGSSHLLPITKNSKKILKNIKFVLLAYFDINIKLKGSDRLFGHRKWWYGPHSTVKQCYAYHRSPILYIYYETKFYNF